MTNLVTDKGLRELVHLRNLEELYLFETRVSDTGIAGLRRDLPKLKIKLEEPDPVATLLAAAKIYRHAVVTVAFSANSKHLVSGSGDGLLRIWPAEGIANPIVIPAHEKWAFSAAFDASGELLASGGGDGLISLWNTRTALRVGQLRGHTDDVHAVAFSPDGRTLYSAGDDNTVRRWDVLRRRQLAILGSHARHIPCLAVSTKGDLVASGSRDHTIRLWDTSSGDLVRRNQRTHRRCHVDSVFPRRRKTRFGRL